MKTKIIVPLAVATVALTIPTLHPLAMEHQIILEENTTLKQSEVVNFPDLNLKAVINQNLGRHDSLDQEITIDELLSLTRLTIVNDKVRDLTGLEYAKNLKSLYIENIMDWGEDNYNHIQDFSIISELVNLQSLTLVGHELSDLSFIKDLVKLTSLDLSDNQISNIEVLEEFINLSNLNLSNNQISNIEVLEELINLWSLNLSNNQISNLNPIRNLTGLSSLEISKNEIKNIKDLNLLKNLRSLDVSYNPIEDISVLTHYEMLENLDISETKILDYSILNQLTQLRELEINNIGLTSLNPIKKLVNLTSLSIDENLLTSLEGIEVFENLYVLSIGGNNINDFSPLNKIPYLTRLVVHNSGIKNLSVFEGLEQIFYLSLDNNHIQDIQLIYSFAEEFSIQEQIIELDPILVKQGGKLVLKNPLGVYFLSDSIYEDEGVFVKDGFFDQLNQKLIWENINVDELEFTFTSFRGGNSRNPSVFSGIVKIPVEFYSVPEAFNKFVEHDAITVIKGTGELETPLVLEITRETKKDVIEELIQSCSDYGYTLKVSQKGITSPFHVYELKFTKDKEEIYFELNVDYTDREIINYLDNKSNDLQESIKFPDVEQDKWYTPHIQEFVSLGFVNGYSDGSFKPGNPITRAEFVKIVNKAFGLADKFTPVTDLPFTDLDSQWKKDELKLALAAGYVTPAAEFRHNAPINRQEAAKIIGYLLGDTLINDSDWKFADSHEIATWAQDYVAGLVEAGVLSKNESFRPKDPITRAEAVKMLNIARGL